MNLFQRLMGRAHPDGGAHVLEASAAGLDDGRAQSAAPAAYAGRQRSRLPADPRTLILASLGQKILHGWSQNRQQTLFPLTVNLRTLAPEARGLILRATAAAMTAVTAVTPPTPREPIRAWFATVGATEADLAHLDEALATPEPLAPLLDAILAAHLGPYAYAVSLAAVDRHTQAGPLYLEYLAARLAVPAHIVKSVNRRYAR